MLSILESVREPIELSAERMVRVEERRDADLAAEPQVVESGEESAGEPSDFEIVMGRSQIASVLFLGIVILVAFSAVSYLAGRSFVPRPPAPAPAIPTVAVPQPEPARAEIAKAEPVNAKPVNADAVKDAEGPLFAEPRNGSLYIQLGAVEKGIAIIMTEGLRKRGLAAFVAPGPNDHIFRVLVGPLDAPGYQHAKETVDGLGLSVFARKYQQ